MTRKSIVFLVIVSAVILFIYHRAHRTWPPLDFTGAWTGTIQRTPQIPPARAELKLTQTYNKISGTLTVGQAIGAMDGALQDMPTNSRLQKIAFTYEIKLVFPTGCPGTYRGTAVLTGDVLKTELSGTDCAGPMSQSPGVFKRN